MEKIPNHEDTGRCKEWSKQCSTGSWCSISRRNCWWQQWFLYTKREDRLLQGKSRAIIWRAGWLWNLLQVWFSRCKGKSLRSSKEIQKASSVHSGWRNRHRPYHLKRYPCLLRARRTGREDSDRHHQPATKSHDGNWVLWYALKCSMWRKRRREAESADGR